MNNDVKFIEGNQKIKLLRKQLKLTQGDFQDSHFTRGYLGLLENGRRNITYNASKYIAAKMMEKAKAQGINLSLEDDYFSRTVEKDVAMFCEYKLNENLSMTELMEIEHIAEKYKLDLYRARAIKRQGDINFNNGKYKEAYKDYFYGLQFMKTGGNCEEESCILDRAGMCKYYMKEYEEALLYLKGAKRLAEESKNKELVIKYTYDMAGCFTKLGKYNLTIWYCEEYTKKSNRTKNTIEYIKIKQLEADAYEKIKDNDKALSIYKDLLEFISKSEENKELMCIKGEIYNSLGFLAGKSNNLAKALENYNKAQNLRSIYDKQNVSDTLYKKSRLYMGKKLYDEALMIVNLGIDKAKEINNMDSMIEGYIILEEIYKNMNMTEDTSEIILRLIELYKKQHKFGEVVRCYLRLQELFYRKNDFDGVFKCTKSIEEILQ